VPTIKVASMNGEWMNDWFTSDATEPAFKPTFTRDGHASNTAATATRSAALIRAVDPDILALEEAPSRREELALFISTYLSDAGLPRYQFVIGDSGGAQKLALLYKPGAVTSLQLTPHSEVTMVVDQWLADVDGDALLDSYQFTRTPLVVDVVLGAHKLRIIVLHTKSNFVNRGKEMWDNPATRQNYVVEALKSRRRNSTEGMRLRTYLDSLLDADSSVRAIVMGDLNDGPGLDYFEEMYLSHNVTDILVGSAFEPEQLFAHAQHDVPPPDRYTAVFDDFVTGTQNAHLLLDHILMSPALIGGSGLRRVKGSGRVHHAEYLAQVQNQGRNREDRPTDHRPVSVTLRY
jgi:endonuclease/exonuclease/phosphatase family metal-dependent hydrolase